MSIYRKNSVEEKYKEPVQRNWGDIIFFSFIALMCCAAGLAIYKIQSKRDREANMCKPNYYVGTYGQAKNLDKVLCFNKEENKEYYYFVEE